MSGVPITHWDSAIPSWANILLYVLSLVLLLQHEVLDAIGEDGYHRSAFAAQTSQVREFGTVYPPHCGSLTLNFDTLNDF